MIETPDQKLADRVRLIGGATGIVILLGWLAWFYPFDNLLDRSGTPWGGDYPTFYIAGRMAVEGDLSRLYDVAEHQRRLQQLAPGIDPAYCLPYRYPPAFALLMAPLAVFPYTVSSALFLILCLALVVASVALLMRATGLATTRWRVTAWWGAATAPVVLEPIIGGQLSPLAVAIVAATAALLKNGKPLAAGAVLALALYKPNVLALFGLICVLRYPRMIIGGAMVVGLWGLVSVCLVGVDGTIGYLRLGSQMALDDWSIQAPAHKLHGLAEWIALVAPGSQRAIVMALGLIAAIWIAHRWRRAGDGPAVFWIGLSAALTINALGNPYVPIYDLALLMPAALMMSAGLIQLYGEELRGKLLPAELLLGSILFGPHLSQALSMQIGVQLFPLLLLLIAGWQLREFSRASLIGIGAIAAANNKPRAAPSGLGHNEAHGSSS